jgi:uncharacterized protein (DUF362 family)
MSQAGARKSLVSVVRVKESVLAAVREAMELAQVLEAIPPGARVCLKPNLGFDLFFPGAVTSPWVIEGVIRALQGRAGSITVVESDQVLVNCEKAMRRTGVERVLRETGVEFVNMSKGRFVEVAVKNPRRLKAIRLPEILTQSVLVTIPVLKTHDKTVLSGAIKNQWGCLEVLRHNYHLVLDEVLTDIHQVLKPAFAVCDATVALEGSGPKTGRPRLVDRILAGRDIVALDAVSARIMGFDPDQIRHLQMLTEAGIGSARDYEVVGEDITNLNYQFEPAKHNFVSRVELGLRHSPWLRKLVFDTPVLDLMCWGATVWYLVWYHLGPGSRIRDQIIKETRYGAQWR